ncbi:flagellar basal body-associated FliL family protein [Luteimonas huabeiensis]|uniref:flagellar basal body-associated FliL family protein n=1 Tax=Luteimonas huabeiensis TaxID=1244513 RepID=UPI0004AFD9CA|nr:flagellar basal body-associated FliL family protein [Luteimonas huabeiensis]
MPAADDARSKPARAPRRRLPLLLALVAVLAAAAAAAWFVLVRPQAPASSLPAPAQYVPMAPPFVVNLDETPAGPRYLQVEVQLLSRDPLAVEQLRRHEPALRARLLMLFAQQTYAGIADRAGKERLRAEALAEVQALMRAETGGPGAEDLLFTSFVTQ